MIAKTITHPKFVSLQRSLGLPLFQTIGLLESLWILAALHADDGDLSRFSEVDIGSFLQWPGDPKELVDLLVEHRWLDRTESGLQIHDWDQNCPRYIHDRRQKRLKRQTNATVSQNISDILRQSENVSEPRRKSTPEQNRTEQEQNRTKQTCLIECLTEIGVSNPEVHIQAAINQGKTLDDIQALIDHFRRAKSQSKPPGAALLACWLKGSQPWPAILPKVEEPYQRPKKPLTVGGD
jgi:hypothetical protein